MPVGGLETDEMLTILGKCSVLAIAYTLACKVLLSNEEFHGSPLYNWLSCLPIQLVWFPYVVHWCVSSFEGDLMGWLVAPWSEMNGGGERYFLFLIYAYMFKDVGMYLVGGKMATMYWAHHLVCWTIILSFFYNNSVGIFIFGGTAMEFGGASQTLHLLMPDSSLFDALHVLTMTVSHVVACGVAVVYFTIPPTALWIRALFTFCVFGLSWERQKHMWTLHTDFANKRAKGN